MKKTYEEPQITVIIFDAVDIITTSEITTEEENIGEWVF